MLTAIFGLIPSLFTTVNGITNAITNERINLAQAQNSSDKIAAQEKIESLQARRDVLVAEAGHSNINAIVRAFIGGSVAIVLGKLLVWDKVVGSFYGCAGEAGRGAECVTFRTDILDPNLWTVITATIAFYFIYEGAVNATRIWKS